MLSRQPPPRTHVAIGRCRCGISMRVESILKQWKTFQPALALERGLFGIVQLARSQRPSACSRSNRLADSYALFRVQAIHHATHTRSTLLLDGTRCFVSRNCNYKSPLPMVCYTAVCRTISSPASFAFRGLRVTRCRPRKPRPEAIGLIRQATISP